MAVLTRRSHFVDELADMKDKSLATENKVWVLRITSK